MRIFSAIVLLGIAALSAIGFMASFEPVQGALAWRFGELESPERAREVHRDIEYDPRPPYVREE